MAWELNVFLYFPIHENISFFQLKINFRRNSYRKGRKFATELGVTDVTFHPIHPMGTHAGQTGGKMYVEPWMTDSTMAPVNHDQPELDLNQIDVGNTLRRNGMKNFENDLLMTF